ncbi:MAG: lytic transglycosylase domain-containing protein [Fusobacteriota bacterium]
MKKFFLFVYIFTFFGSLGYAIYTYVLPVHKINVIAEEARKKEVELPIILAIIKVESKFQEDAISHKGAVGMMQIMPNTSKWLIEEKGVEIGNADLLDYKTNIKLGIAYYKILYDYFYGDREKILAGYNAGISRVEDGSWERIEETRNYVDKVLFYEKIYDLIY